MNNYFLRDLSDAKAYAQNYGCEVIQADEKTLLIDLDSYEDKVRFDEMRSFIEKWFSFEAVEVWPSKSDGDHVHVKVTLGEKFSILERLLLEACLGNDLKRSFYCFLRAHRKMKEDEISLLFKPLHKS